jgi:carboxymethylenebutenolidase
MNLFQKYLLDEFVEEYQEKRLTRREALKMIASITGSLVLANSILAACAPLDDETPAAQPAAPSATSASAGAENTPTTAMQAATDTPEMAEPTATRSVPEAESYQPDYSAGGASPQGEFPAHGTVAADDPLVIAGVVEFPSGEDTVTGYLSRPASGEPAPVILVCHENRGLTPHIEDVTRRLAKAGYVALAVDLLSRQGGSASLGSENVPGALSGISPDQFVQDFTAGWTYLQSQEFALTERTGMTGFCFGGGVTWQLAVHMPELKAVVPFYGPHPDLPDVPQIQAAVLAVYGENDTRINAGIPAMEAAMQENSKIYQKLVYPNADHAFFNDTGTRYNAEAAADAWAQMLAWFQQYV